MHAIYCFIKCRTMFRNTCTPVCLQNIHGHRLAAGSFHSQLAQQCLCRLLAPTEDVPAFCCIWLYGTKSSHLCQKWGLIYSRSVHSLQGATMLQHLK